MKLDGAKRIGEKLLRAHFEENAKVIHHFLLTFCLFSHTVTQMVVTAKYTPPTNENI